MHHVCRWDFLRHRGHSHRLHGVHGRLLNHIVSVRLVHSYVLAHVHRVQPCVCERCVCCGQQLCVHHRVVRCNVLVASVHRGLWQRLLYIPVHVHVHFWLVGVNVCHAGVHVWLWQRILQLAEHLYVQHRLVRHHVCNAGVFVGLC